MVCVRDVFIIMLMQSETQLHISEYKFSLDFVVQKYPLPEDWQYENARELFRKPEVLDGASVEVSLKSECVKY